LMAPAGHPNLEGRPHDAATNDREDPT
jgi:hypothetical protein